jgi:ABC-type branched-subunit amino acid transport system ATPase component
VTGFGQRGETLAVDGCCHYRTAFFAMLSVIQVSKTYAGRTLFSRVGFHLQRGDKVGLIGPNGAGKSTLFSLLMGMALPMKARCGWSAGRHWASFPKKARPWGTIRCSAWRRVT